MIRRLNDMDYATRKTFALLFLLLYAGIGFTAHAVSGDRGEDAYPFFSWFLFVNVPQRVQTGFDVQVTAIDGQPVAPVSILVSDAYRNELRAREIVALESRLGDALKYGGTQEGTDARRALESGFTKNVTYRVREITYDPLAYFKDKTVLRETILAEFSL